MTEDSYRLSAHHMHFGEGSDGRGQRKEEESGSSIAKISHGMREANSVLFICRSMECKQAS